MSTLPATRFRLLFAALLLGLVGLFWPATPGCGQDDEDSSPPPPALFVADDKPRAEMESAEAAARAGQWGKAIGHWLAAREKFPQAVWKLEDGHAWIGLEEYVDRRLASLPAEGLEAYRSSAEPAALARFSKARERGDLNALIHIARDDSLTSVGDDAAWICARAAAARGDFAAAVDWTSRLLRHPTSFPRLLLLSHLALWSAAAGDLDRCSEANEAAAAAGREPVAGDPPLPELTARCLAAAHERHPDRLPPGEWPTSGGDPTRTSRVAEHPAGQMKAYGWPPGTNANNGAGQPRHADDSLDLEILPVVSCGRVILPIPLPQLLVPPETRSAIALDLMGGEERWGMPDTHPAGFQESGRGACGSFLFGGTAEQGRVYLNLLAPIHDDIAGLEMGGRCVALDAETGAVRWDTQNRTESIFHEPGTFSPPMAVGGLICFAALFVHAEPEVHVIAVDAVSGALRWSTFLCSGIRPQGAIVACTPTLSESNGRLYCCTNVGAVAAIEARTGTILWLSPYGNPAPPVRGLPVQPRSSRQRSMLPSPNLPLLRGTSCYFLPTDESGLFVADITSGVVTSVPGSGGARYLAGITDRWLIVSDGTESFTVLDRTGAIAPSRVKLGNNPTGGVVVCGRPLLTEEIWYFPTNKALERHERFRDATPDNRILGGRLCDAEPGPCCDPGDLPSNCTVADRWVLVTSGQKLVALFEQATFDALFAHSKGLGFYLDHARVMEQNSRYTDAMADYRKILSLLSLMQDPSDADREIEARARSGLSVLHRRLGDDAVRLERWEDAVAHYMSGLEVSKSAEDAAPLRFALAAALERSVPPREKEAAEVYSRLLEDGARKLVDAGDGLRTGAYGLALARLGALREKDPQKFDAERAQEATSFFVGQPDFVEPIKQRRLFLAAFPFAKEAPAALRESMPTTTTGVDFLRRRLALLPKVPDVAAFYSDLIDKSSKTTPAQAWSLIVEAERRIAAASEGSPQERKAALQEIAGFRGRPEFEPFRTMSSAPSDDAVCRPLRESALIAPLTDDIELAKTDEELKNSAAPWICTLSAPSAIAPEGFGMCRGGEFQWRSGPEAAAKRWTLPDARPWIGIRQSHSFAPPGVLIEKVYAGQPAEAAGLKAKDVLVAADDNPIDSLAGLIAFLSTCPANANVQLTVSRSGRHVVCPTALVPRPALFGTPVSDVTLLDDGGLVISRPFQLTAVERNGTVRWRFPGSLTTLPQLDCVGASDGRVFVLVQPVSDGADFLDADRNITRERLIALDAASGAVEWQRLIPPATPRIFRPVPGLGGILVGAPRRLDWFDGPTGLSLWGAETMVGMQDSQPFPVLLDGTFCVYAEAPGVWHGLDLATRRDRWRLPVEQKAYAPVQIRLGSGAVFWISKGGTATSVDLTTGQSRAAAVSVVEPTVLTTLVDFVILGPTAVASASNMKTSSDADPAPRVTAFDWPDGTLRRRWETAFPVHHKIELIDGFTAGVLGVEIEDPEGVPAPPAGATPPPANIFLLEPLKGERVWEAKVPVSAAGAMPPVSVERGRVLVGGADGVHVLEAAR